MATLSSEVVENKILALFFKSPCHMKSVNVDLNTFTRNKTRKLAELIKTYTTKYKKPPTKDTLAFLCNTMKLEAKELSEYVSALDHIDDLPEATVDEFDFYFEKANNYRTGRQIFDLAEFVKEKFEANDEIDFVTLHKNLVTKALSIKSEDDHVNRGFVYENVENRWENYKKLERGEVSDDIIPFGMKGLDDVLGGMRRTFLTLIYSKTGGGKSRTAINIAVNAALAGKNVVYFSLEMAFDLLASCVDSRLSLTNSNHILFGKLDTDDKGAFKKALIDQAKKKLGLWIVDIPMGAKSSDIMNELEKYKASTGLAPDLVIVDYANLVEPMISYNGRSEKYDFLFKELHEIARIQKVAMLTATQETREKSKSDKGKKSKEEDTEGVENIGLSNYIAPHCEIVLRIKQNKFDKIQNRVWIMIDKYRYGASVDQIPLMSRWDLTYVGDRLIPGTAGIRIFKESTGPDFSSNEDLQNGDEDLDNE